MFIGQYAHHLEEKGRLSIPKKFRSGLEAGAILSQGLDGCLFLYPKDTWLALTTQLQALPLTQGDARSFVRALSYTAVEVEIDRQGRVLVPEYLKRYAGINSECVVAGALERIEVWDAARFAKYVDRASSTAEEIAEKLNFGKS